MKQILLRLPTYPFESEVIGSLHSVSNTIQLHKKSEKKPITLASPLPLSLSLQTPPLASFAASLYHNRSTSFPVTFLLNPCPCLSSHLLHCCTPSSLFLSSLPFPCTCCSFCFTCQSFHCLASEHLIFSYNLDLYSSVTSNSNTCNQNRGAEHCFSFRPCY